MNKEPQTRIHTRTRTNWAFKIITKYTDFGVFGTLTSNCMESTRFGNYILGIHGMYTISIVSPFHGMWHGHVFLILTCNDNIEYSKHHNCMMCAPTLLVLCMCVLKHTDTMLASPAVLLRRGGTDNVSDKNN